MVEHRKLRPKFVGRSAASFHWDPRNEAVLAGHSLVVSHPLKSGKKIHQIIGLYMSVPFISFYIPIPDG